MVTKKLFLNCLSALLLGLSVSGCNATSRAPLNEGIASLAIDGIEPGMSVNEVVRRKGHSRGQETHDGFIKLEMKYPTVVVGFDEANTVVMVESASEKACILTSICPGAPLALMQKELDSGRYSAEMVDNKLIINGDGCWGEVFITETRASSVRVRCSP